MFSLTPNHLQKAQEKEGEVFSHPTWHGKLIGLDCEDLLRDMPTNSYLLREGEARFHYYFSYVLEAPFMFKHQPFSISMKDFELGWGYRNGHTWWAEKLNDFISLIMHNPIEKCIPIVTIQKKY